jgi:ribosomal protein S18 acetylase RimI-like enzyme
MRIVRADGSRLDELEPLFRAMHEHHRAGRPRAAEVLALRSGDEAWGRRRDHYRRLFEGGGGHLLLAEDCGRVIGYAVVAEIGPQATLETGARMVELESLAVLPGERGAGVGTALMAAVHEVIRELGIDELMLYVMDGNESALRFYERYGMRPYMQVLVGTVTAFPAPPPGAPAGG